MQKKVGLKNVWKFVPLRGGGVGRLRANAILNFHFDYPHTSLKLVEASTLNFKVLNESRYSMLGSVVHLAMFHLRFSSSSSVFQQFVFFYCVFFRNIFSQIVPLKNIFFNCVPQQCIVSSSIALYFCNMYP